VALPTADITGSDFKARAYDYYAQLRAQAPVQPAKVLGQTAWLVSRYDDVASLLKDARLAKDRHNAKGSRPFSRLPGVLGFLQAIERNMLDVDAPDHTRLRGLVHLAFTPRLVDRMRARIEGLSEELLARAMAKGTMDVIADYALPIPLTVISEMLGIPTADQHRFHRREIRYGTADPGRPEGQGFRRGEADREDRRRLARRVGRSGIARGPAATAVPPPGRHS